MADRRHIASRFLAAAITGGIGLGVGCGIRYAFGSVPNGVEIGWYILAILVVASVSTPVIPPRTPGSDG